MRLELRKAEAMTLRAFVFGPHSRGASDGSWRPNPLVPTAAGGISRRPTATTAPPGNQSAIAGASRRLAARTAPALGRSPLVMTGAANTKSGKTPPGEWHAAATRRPEI